MQVIDEPPAWDAGTHPAPDREERDRWLGRSRTRRTLDASDEDLIDGTAGGSGTTNADGSVGKHLLLMVPDFTSDDGLQNPAVGATPLNSYLRLGMADTRAGDLTQIGLGEDLAGLVTGFTDDFRNRDGGSAPNSPIAPGDPPYPLAVRVDGGTASAAELFTGSLRAHGRALVIGERTYGKSLVRTLVAGRFVEAGRFRLPGRVDVDGIGVQPDASELPPDWPHPA